MSDNPYGPYVQNAYIVPDLDAAIDYWVKVMDVGPFFKFPPLELPTGIYRGRPETIRFDAEIAYSGDMQIELIQATGPNLNGDRGGISNMLVSSGARCSSI